MKFCMFYGHTTEFGHNLPLPLYGRTQSQRPLLCYKVPSVSVFTCLTFKRRTNLSTFRKLNVVLIL
ncbi:unnamed protein product [Nesidiocoris tenuis]|uniref:Uncharacterized protein n=1 Tax=Nesidiocoris tenuis TaxID=355587 RepID=A0A6H5H980_9HEMI|nr:unnamed protein product [Nesidiocoris tenuis]